MNTIYKNQNDKVILMLQYSANRYYNRAERLALCSWLVCIANLFVKIPCVSSFLGVWSAVVPMAISVFFVPLLAEKTNKYTQIGAATRQLIDYKLFGFTQLLYYNGYTEEQLKEYAAVEKNTNPKDYECQINHSGTDEEHGVKDWYTVENTMQQEQAIRECQRQNKMFDNMLTKTLFVLVKFVLVVMILFIFVLFGNNTVNDTIVSLAIVTPLITKLSGSIRSYFDLREYNNKWKKMFDKPDISCEERQECIDERRRMVFIVPHVLHSLKSKKLHNMVKDSMNV